MSALRTCVVFLLGIGFGVSVGAIMLSDLPAVHADDSNGDQAPRYMLSGEGHPAVGSSDRRPTAADFAWNQLTGNGAGSGKNPVIGEGSGKPYYDFRDGLPHPYYIAPSPSK